MGLTVADGRANVAGVTMGTAAPTGSEVAGEAVAAMAGAGADRAADGVAAMTAAANNSANPVEAVTTVTRRRGARIALHELTTCSLPAIERFHLSVVTLNRRVADVNKGS